MQNLILGVLDRISYPRLRNFMASIKLARFDGHISMHVGPQMGKRTIKKLEKAGIELIPFSYDYPYVSGFNMDLFADPGKRLSIYCLRHVLYFNFLDRNSANYAKVLLTDVRDVIFQKNPFSFPLTDNVYVAMESDHINLIDENLNRQWVVRVYGTSVAERIGMTTISCAGTTIGPLNRIKQYLKAMLEEICVHGTAIAEDQGMHNFVVHSKKVVSIKKSFNSDGLFLTLGITNKYFLRNDRIYSESSSIPHIVHQYDRHPDLDRFCQRKYFTMNPIVVWLERKLYKHFP